MANANLAIGVKSFTWSPNSILALIFNTTTTNCRQTKKFFVKSLEKTDRYSLACGSIFFNFVAFFAEKNLSAELKRLVLSARFNITLFNIMTIRGQTLPKFLKMRQIIN